ncbi:Polygalacturonase [Pseudozyma hubeiensis]|nr:Polygalacturonase [Pseudozyma hubeiensis]
MRVSAITLLTLPTALPLLNSTLREDCWVPTHKVISAPQISLPLHKEDAKPIVTHWPAQNWTNEECIVKPLGWGRDDSSQIQEAVLRCGNGGTITLPAPYTYTIANRMYMKLNHARLNVHGLLSFTPDLGNWIGESHRVEFQNQSTAWIVEGNNYHISGGGWQQGGILGNGQAWYGRAAGQSNQFGRPISISLYNSTNATIDHFSFYQPQFWSMWVQDSKNVHINNIYINGSNTDPAGNSSNYATNIDGLDTMRVDGLHLANWNFRGGDDCFAPKGNTTNVVLRNFTCVGGGIAFGSVGQFPGSPDYITNVSVSDIKVSGEVSKLYGGAKPAGGAYFKSWVGVSMGKPPQGGGGGSGRVSNVTFKNLEVDDTTQAVFINKCYYKVKAQADFCDTSKFQFDNLSFHNVTGKVLSPDGINLNCSAVAPCHNVTFSSVDVSSAVTNKTAAVVLTNTVNVTGVADAKKVIT